jgi:hypothetical protein
MEGSKTKARSEEDGDDELFEMLDALDAQLSPASSAADDWVRRILDLTLGPSPLPS